MINLRQNEEILIKKGDMRTLKEVIARNLQERQERLIHELVQVQTLQGQCQVLKALLELID